MHPGSMLRLVLLLALALQARARITDTHIANDARPGILLSRPFGFGIGGYLLFNVSDVKIHGKALKDTDLSLFGFYIAQNVGDELAEDASFTQTSAAKRCSFITPSTPALLTFQNSSIAGKINHDNGRQVPYNTPQQYLGMAGGQDVLFFANCEQGAAVSFSIHIEMFNIDRWGNHSYLSVGELELPPLYLVRAQAALSLHLDHGELLQLHPMCAHSACIRSSACGAQRATDVLWVMRNALAHFFALLTRLLAHMHGIYKP